MKRIHDSLQRVFERTRLVFWYDPTGEWEETYRAFPDPKVTKLQVRGNELGTKVRIVREPDLTARFLVYLPTPRPPDADNWRPWRHRNCSGDMYRGVPMLCVAAPFVKPKLGVEPRWHGSEPESGGK